MARITRVKKAQQRYETVKVLDDKGQPVKVPVLHQRGPKKGEQVVTKRGPKFLTLTTLDKTKPKPNLRCDFPGCDIDGREILPGTPYMWIKPKSGPYGGHLKARHAQHPAWNVWDYSSSLSAQTQRIAHDFWEAIANVEDPDDVTSALEDAASQIEELAQEKRDGAENIESGFGHATYQSEELEQTADDLDGWAEEVRSVDVPDTDDYLLDDQVDCTECDGNGQVENPDYDPDDEDSDEDEEIECPECGGLGQVDNDDPDVDYDEWREALNDACSVVDECPV